MSDALQTILADPELQNWPQRGTSEMPAVPAPELVPPPFTPPRLTDPGPAAGTGWDLAPERADAPTTAVTAPAYQTATAPENIQFTDTAHPTAPDRDAVTAPADDDPYDPPHANSTTHPQETDDDNDDDAHHFPHHTPAFDEITRRAHPFSDKFHNAAEWAKNNWRRPKVLTAGAATLIALASLAALPSTRGADPEQPTATLTSPATEASPAPAAASPVNGSIPVRFATARCPAPSSDPMNALRLAAPAAGQPWICVRAWGIDGQVLTVGLDGSWVIDAVRIMPGANSEANGEDLWPRYRTVSRVAWTFNDATRTKLTQCTDSRRELLTQTLAAPDCLGKTATGPVVASQVELTIEKTDAPPSAPTGTGPAVLDGQASGEAASAFAVSHLEIIGHRAG